MTMMDDYNQPETPLWADMMDSAPGALVGAAWNMGRVSNTITRGGTAGQFRRWRQFRKGEGSVINYAEGRGRGGIFRGGVTQTFGPRHGRRLTRPANIDPSFYGEKSGIYSPFNILSHAGNTIMNKLAGNSKIRANEATAGLMDKATGGAMGKGEKYFSPGTMGRILANNKIANMSDKALNRSSGNIMSAIADLNPKVFGGMEQGLTGVALRGELQAGMLSTITGRTSGRVAGYIAGAEAQNAAIKTGSTELVDRLMAKTTGAALEGVKGGVGGRIAETSLARFVGSGAVSGALRGANIAGWILLAHDAAMMGGKLIGRGIRTGIEAAQSVKGSIDKPVMGMGFKDNTVAATSRQRGVAAIANSRLNARSILGSEGGMMAAHFG